MYPATPDEGLACQLSETQCCPVPESVTVAGEPVALLVIVIVPLALPPDVGLNCTDSATCCVGIRITAPPPVIENAVPARVVDEMLTLELPVFVIVTLCAVDDVASSTLPKFSVVGLMLSVNVAAVPVPVRPIEVGEVGALLVIEMLPIAEPATVGKKPAVIVVCCPAFTVIGSVNPLTLYAEPVAPTAVIVNVAVPVFEMTIGCDRLVPTTELPKLIEVGFTEMAGAGAGFTVRVAALLVAFGSVPLLTVTVNVDPLSAVVVTGVV